MTFDEAGQRFAHLEAQFRAGQIPQHQFTAAAAELRVVDPAGAWWQIDPATRTWLKWNGAAWVNPNAPTPQAYPHAPAPARPGGTVTVPQTTQSSSAGPGAWDGIVSVIPGIAVDGMMRWSVYKDNPSMAVGVAAPALLSAILVPLVPKIGKLLPTLIVLGCLVWLSWPVIEQWSEISQQAKGVQSQAGRGLVGVSLLYLIPRIWKTKTG